MLASFINWHLRLGFCRLYLYFDDPGDDGIAEARRLRREATERGLFADCITIVPVDDGVRAEWSGMTTAERWDLPKVWHHVEVRQLLNAEHALRRAHAAGDIEWLLHIDSDELFHVDDLDAAGHFGRLSAHGCYNFRYTLHEGCPEAADSLNVFESVTLFRRHPATLEEATSEARAVDVDSVRSALAYWTRPNRQYFLGSIQGKSATRVLAGCRPMSVHTFYPPDPSMLRRCWAGFHDGQDAIACSLQVVKPSHHPCILHYISCDFGFWHHKYQLLGHFTDKPGGAAVGGDLPPEAFHVQSRDLVAQVDEATARESYERTVCVLDGAEAERQVTSAVCMRVTLVRDVLVDALIS